MAWLTVLICYGGNWVLGQCMISVLSWSASLRAF